MLVDITSAEFVRIVIRLLLKKLNMYVMRSNTKDVSVPYDVSQFNDYLCQIKVNPEFDNYTYWLLRSL